MGFGLGLGPLGLLIQFGGGYLAMLEEEKARKAQYDENVRRYEETLGNLRSLRDRTLPEIQRIGRESAQSVAESYGITTKRLAELSKQYDQRFERAKTQLDRLEKQGEIELKRNVAVAKGKSSVDLVRRGLGSSFLRTAAQIGITRAGNEALNAQKESVAGRRIQIEGTLGAAATEAERAEIETAHKGRLSVAEIRAQARKEYLTADSNFTQAENQIIASREDVYEPTNEWAWLTDTYGGKQQAHQKQRAAAKAAEGGKGGAYGAAAGIGIAGLVLAPFTFGASAAVAGGVAAGTGAAAAATGAAALTVGEYAALVGLAGSAGGTLGNAIDPAPGYQVPQTDTRALAGLNFRRPTYQRPNVAPPAPVNNGMNGYQVPPFGYVPSGYGGF